jgi:SAM-dependent methyltransferase
VTPAFREDQIRPRGPFDTYLELVRNDCHRFFGTPDSFRRVACPACDSDDAQPEFEKEGFQYGQCRDCGTLYAMTRPGFESLQRFYTDSPSTDYWIKEFFSPVAEVRRQKMFKPRAEYVRERFGTDPRWVVGDIGAGFGLFSSELKALWPESRHVAIEPSAEMAALCDGAGLEVLCETLEGLSDQEEYAGTFDLLTAFELFEHLHNPHTFAEAAFRLLKPGGRLMLTTLNPQ